MTALSFDLAILVCSGISFLAFFLLQVIVFRIVHPEAVLRWIMNIFMIVSVLHLFTMAIAYNYLQLDYPGGVLLMAAVSYFIFGLIAFVYILCVFGPSETSIRIRLVRELREIKGGRLTHDELLKKYNGRLILERRIQRLLYAGEIIEQNGKYVLLNKANAFFMIDAVAGLIQKILKKS
jgi:hypothetical protein